MNTATSRRMAAADAWDHDCATWHASQLVYWRQQLAQGGPVPASRCAIHVQRHERRVLEIADRSLASLANRAGHAGARA